MRTRTERRVIDNRVFLLGLDELYRDAMKLHEKDELLRCAQETACALSVRPAADVPIEGYYTEDPRLTEYFRLMRALQQVPRSAEARVSALGAFHRLKQVTESPIFGPSSEGNYLFSSGEDSLSAALRRTFPEWTIENLTATAYKIAAGSSEFSLVALAALSRDAVVLTALRESVVLYAAAVGGCAMIDEPQYIWEVDEFIQKRATQFVETFNKLFDENLPLPTAENAEDFWYSAKEWKIIGRCVRIGFDDSVPPVRHYHWAIDIGADHRAKVTEFWDTRIWTTAEYRAKQEAERRGRWK